MTTPEENKLAEEKIISKDRYISINEIIIIIDKAYKEYLDDKLSTSDSMIAKIKHKLRSAYTVEKKSLIKKEK